jgi:hypothetical protein
MLIDFAFGQFFDWRFVTSGTMLAGGNPKFPALVALDPDAVLVYPAVLSFADAVLKDKEIARRRTPQSFLVSDPNVVTSLAT